MRRRHDAGEANLPDPQIVQVTTESNTGEIAQANAALAELTNASSKDFANMMVAMHSAAQQRQEALAAQKGITPTPSDVSTTLKSESDQRVRN